MNLNEKFDKEKIERFEKENSEFLNNNLVASFLKVPSNKKVYLRAISSPTIENKNELDMLFKEFYFNIRFTSHISSTIKFNSINFDKRLRLWQSRVNTTLDAHIKSDEGDETFLDLIFDETNTISLDSLLSKEDITKQISCPILHDAVEILTSKQKQIINLAYVEGLNDTEISVLLEKSQQAISKMHKKALNRLLEYIESNKDKGGRVDGVNGNY